jgi:hypothetical protein
MPIYAATSSEAGFMINSIQLIDLNPLDGITPSISFKGTYNYSSTYVFDQMLGAQKEYELDDLVTNQNHSQYLSVSATASLTMQNSFIQSMYVEGTGNYEISHRAAGLFTLSANTVLVLSLNFYGSAIVNDAVPNYYSVNYLKGEFSISGPLGPNSVGYQTSSINDSAFGGLGYAGYQNQFNHTLGLSFINMNNQSINGLFGATLFTYGHGEGNASAVPEVQENMMLMAGLALLGFLVRRRQR